MYQYCKSALLILLIASITASCGSGTSSADTTADPIATEVGITSGVPNGTTFDSTDIKIMYAPTQENDETLFAAEEENGDLLNDEVYHRNLTVMDRLNVAFSFTIIPVDDIINFTRTSVQAGDDSFNMITGAQYQLVKLINDGLFINLIDAPYIDVEKPWWAGDYIDNVNIGSDRRYFLTGDITPLFLRWISCCYFNKALYENVWGDPDSMYKIVTDGKWTFDKLNELSKDIYVDVNNNGVTDEGDMVSYGIMSAALADAFYYNGGASVVDIGKDGLPTLNPVTERTVAIMEKLHTLYYENPASYVFPASWDNLNKKSTAKFAADEMLFQFGYFFTSDYLRDMKSDYGVIPFPKLTDADEYRALVHNDVSLCAIPVTCDDVDAVAAVLEELAFQGYQMTSPTYYNIVLKDKYMRDSSDTAVQIIDMIHDHAYTETGYAYASMIESAGYMHRLLIDAKSADITSKWASMKQKAEQALKKLIENASDVY